jgi:nitrile hydratase subunit alpha
LSYPHTHHHDSEESIAARTRAIETLLVEKGLVTADAIDEIVAKYERDIGPLHGAGVVARAWVDPDYRRRLLQDASSAMAELGVQYFIVVLENTPGIHNVVCCTLCSCYPWQLLGLPPTWYKSPAYRSRIVIDPRSVLREFGTEIDESVELRVWDSTAQMRYMVLPERPAGTEHLTESDLASLVTRDALIGVTTLPSVI